MEVVVIEAMLEGFLAMLGFHPFFGVFLEGVRLDLSNDIRPIEG